LRGSWAGAMGQCQFMPSSFLEYAVSYGGAGQPDIWTDRADVFASIANYLARLGWSDRETWGRMALVPPDLSPDLVGPGVTKPLLEWRRLGVRRADGGPLPAVNVAASLLMPEGQGGPALLVYGNFRTLLRWNNSQAFATSVGLLADSDESR
jgi:membrane-bound lytic murein transglycosylase B